MIIIMLMYRIVISNLCKTVHNSRAKRYTHAGVKQSICAALPEGECTVLSHIHSLTFQPM